MLWSILIATLSWRERKFLALLDGLLPQAEEFPGQVEVVALRNHGELLIGDYRQAMISDPQCGDYLSFLDDDDLAAGYYVREVMGALRQSPDIVGFTATVTGCGDLSKTVFSIGNPGWKTRQGTTTYHRATSWSPVRTTLARQGSYVTRGTYEDEAYAASLAPHLDGAREVTVSRPLLTYTGAHLDSCQFGGPAVPIGPLTGLRGPDERPEVSSSSFRWFEGEVTPAQPVPRVRQPVAYTPQD